MIFLRAFIAVEIEEKVKEKIISLQNEIKKRFKNEIKYVEPENLHFTLRFFSDVDEKTAEKIKKIIEDLDFYDFELRCKGIGVFPNEKYIRVIWIGGESGGILEEIEKRISDKLAEIGIKKEGEKFVAHLTIGRVKQRIDLRDFIKKYKDYDFGSFIVKKEMIKLKKSQLTPKGPIYTDL